MQHPLDHLGGHELVALDPLQVRAVADVLARPPEGQRLDAVDVLLARVEVQAGDGIVHLERHADVDAAQVVDDLDEAEHADPDEVVDADASHLLDRLPQASRATDLEQRVDLHGAGRVGLLARVAGTAVALVHRHHGVARDAHYRDPVPSGRDVHEHDRVGVVALVVAGAQDVLLVRGQAGPAVVAVDQDVQGVGAVYRRPVAERGRRHGDAGDAVVDGAVLQVRGQRAPGHDHDRRDGNPAEHVPLAPPRLPPHA